MVSEHKNNNFKNELMDETFSWQMLGSSISAILSGLVASISKTHIGNFAPFDIAFIALMIGTLYIISTWDNSKIERRSDDTLSIIPAIQLIFSKQILCLYGLVQALFEAALFVFAVMWTPAFPPDVNLGIIFAVLMISVMFGSYIFMNHKTRSMPLMLVGICSLSSISLSIPYITSSPPIRLGAFVLFEMCYGVYSPCYKSISTELIPDAQRATVMNLFRVPLNIIVVIFCAAAGRCSVEIVRHEFIYIYIYIYIYCKTGESTDFFNIKFTYYMYKYI
eukprot:GHVL01035519.1.p1 GENE.GHVL01035519.1~~GHVL01035519.1.p1  ORF type:complete len:278 (-),score=27.06 GHVL01035519.1:238-1071(-)